MILSVTTGIKRSVVIRCVAECEPTKTALSRGFMAEKYIETFIYVLNNELKPIFRIINPNYRFCVARAFPRECLFPCLFLGVWGLSRNGCNLKTTSGFVADLEKTNYIFLPFIHRWNFPSLRGGGIALCHFIGLNGVIINLSLLGEIYHLFLPKRRRTPWPVKLNFFSS